MRLRQHGVCPRDGLAHSHRRGRRANRTIGARGSRRQRNFEQHLRASPAPIHLHRPVPRVKQARRGGSERDHLRSAFGLLPKCSAERVGQQCVEPRRRSVACIDQPGVARVPRPETLRRPRLEGAGFWRRTRLGCAGRQYRCTAPSWPSVEHCSGRPGADGRARNGASFIAGCRYAPAPGATP